MTIEIENSYGDVPVPEYQEIIRNVAEKALDYVQCPYETVIYVLLTDNEAIRKINLEQRGIDRPTDVLSFPMAEYPVSGDFSTLEEKEPDVFHPETGELLLGDIVISMDKVRAQAGEYGHSMQRELAFLTAHSMLHLTGYDHMAQDERLLMEEKQEEILRLCGYIRKSP